MSNALFDLTPQNQNSTGMAEIARRVGEKLLAASEQRRTNELEAQKLLAARYEEIAKDARIKPEHKNIALQRAMAIRFLLAQGKKLPKELSDKGFDEFLAVADRGARGWDTPASGGGAAPTSAAPASASTAPTPQPSGAGSGVPMGAAGIRVAQGANASPAASGAPPAGLEANPFGAAQLVGLGGVLPTPPAPSFLTRGEAASPTAMPPGPMGPPPAPVAAPAAEASALPASGHGLGVESPFYTDDEIADRESQMLAKRNLIPKGLIPGVDQDVDARGLPYMRSVASAAAQMRKFGLAPDGTPLPLEGLSLLERAKVAHFRAQDELLEAQEKVAIARARGIPQEISLREREFAVKQQNADTARAAAQAAVSRAANEAALLGLGGTGGGAGAGFDASGADDATDAGSPGILPQSAPITPKGNAAGDSGIQLVSNPSDYILVTDPANPNAPVQFSSAIQSLADQVHSGQADFEKLGKLKPAVSLYMANNGMLIVPPEVRGKLNQFNSARAAIGDVGQDGRATGLKGALLDFVQTQLADPGKKYIAWQFLESRIDGFGALIGRAMGERGVFTDQDQARFRRLTSPGLLITIVSPQAAAKWIRELEAVFDDVESREFEGYFQRYSTGGSQAPVRKPKAQPGHDPGGLFEE